MFTVVSLEVFLIIFCYKSKAHLFTLEVVGLNSNNLLVSLLQFYKFNEVNYLEISLNHVSGLYIEQYVKTTIKKTFIF